MLKLISVVLLLTFNSVRGQTVKLSCFDKELKNEDSQYPILVRTCFIKNFKFINKSYPDDVERYFDSEKKVYVRINKKFIRITNAKVFNKKQNELVSIINKRIQEDYKRFSTDPETKECLVGLDSIPTYKMDDFEISFDGVEIWFEVHWGLSMVCRSVDGTIVTFLVSEIEKYLN